MNNHIPATYTLHKESLCYWLEVPYAALVALHLDGVISQFSYIAGDTVYLDEDYDAPIFMQNWLRCHGKSRKDYHYFWAICQTVWDGHTSFIHDFDQYAPRW